MTTDGAKPNSETRAFKGDKSSPTPSPSASVLVISAKNDILLLRRVQSSTSFASAHVFPGGHISPQDGTLPPLNDVRRHEDSEAYRISAIRECFEETGILIANKKGSDGLLELNDKEREESRHAVHNEKIPFKVWLNEKDAIANTASLIPFTRWLTPINVPRQRFSTQMYIYFLPLSCSSKPRAQNTIPTSDGGVENTEAGFKPVAEWLRLFRANELILFPPQFYLLSLLAPFLHESSEIQTLQAQRDALLSFVERKEDGEPSWGEKSISPQPLFKLAQKMVFGLDQPGPELAATGRKGDGKRVITWIFKDGRPQELQVRWRADVEREKIEALEGGMPVHIITREEAEKERHESQYSGGRQKL
ncbi:MAG: hypothetical protein HETSPECPRED_001378 [Heterodermia speciosa]|uniref:Nudix hydrolase domain-containing protein n=1 Tax=Heterodermia speciosa TaxID=116794 RepID=A0A8H3I363_9LECA|nr:MAG: hypothetical protein HETSPECPRED_001378 [Heterodermia speciosa]